MAVTAKALHASLKYGLCFGIRPNAVMLPLEEGMVAHQQTGQELTEQFEKLSLKEKNEFLDAQSKGLSLREKTKVLELHLKNLTPGDTETILDELDDEVAAKVLTAGLEVNTEALPKEQQALYLTDMQSALLMAGLLKLVVLAFFIERLFSHLYDHELFLGLERLFGLRAPIGAEEFDEKGLQSGKSVAIRRGLKAVITFGVAFSTCTLFEFNLIDGVFPHQLGEHEWLGYVLTAAVLAGGSEGAIKLMQDFLGMRGELRRASIGRQRQTLVTPTTTITAITPGQDRQSIDESTGKLLLLTLKNTGKSAKGLAAALGGGWTENKVLALGQRPVTFTREERTQINAFFGQNFF